MSVRRMPKLDLTESKIRAVICRFPQYSERTEEFPLSDTQRTWCNYVRVTDANT